MLGSSTADLNGAKEDSSGVWEELLPTEVITISFIFLSDFCHPCASPMS